MIVRHTPSHSRSPPMDASALQEQLRQRSGLRVRLDWLQAAVDFSRQQNASSLAAAERALFEQMLFQDLCTVVDSSGGLPSDIDRVVDQVLDGQFLLQVEEVVDLSMPREKAIEEIDIDDSAKREKELRQRHHSGHTMKLLLSDGFKCIAALEVVHCPDLSVDLPIGCKVLVRNAHVQRGHLLLYPDCFRVVGGTVPALIESTKDRKRTRQDELKLRGGRCNLEAVNAAAAASLSTSNNSPIIISSTQSQRTDNIPSAVAPRSEALPRVATFQASAATSVFTAPSVSSVNSTRPAAAATAAAAAAVNQSVSSDRPQQKLFMYDVDEFQSVQPSTVAQSFLQSYQVNSLMSSAASVSSLSNSNNNQIDLTSSVGSPLASAPLVNSSLLAPPSADLSDMPPLQPAFDDELSEYLDQEAEAAQAIAAAEAAEAAPEENDVPPALVYLSEISPNVADGTQCFIKGLVTSLREFTAEPLGLSLSITDGSRDISVDVHASVLELMMQCSSDQYNAMPDAERDAVVARIPSAVRLMHGLLLLRFRTGRDAELMSVSPSSTDVGWHYLARLQQL